MAVRAVWEVLKAIYLFLRPKVAMLVMDGYWVYLGIGIYVVWPNLDAIAQFLSQPGLGSFWQMLLAFGEQGISADQTLQANVDKVMSEQLSAVEYLKTVFGPILGSAATIVWGVRAAARTWVFIEGGDLSPMVGWGAGLATYGFVVLAFRHGMPFEGVQLFAANAGEVLDPTRVMAPVDRVLAGLPVVEPTGMAVEGSVNATATAG